MKTTARKPRAKRTPAPFAPLEPDTMIFAVDASTRAIGTALFWARHGHAPHLEDVQLFKCRGHYTPLDRVDHLGDVLTAYLMRLSESYRIGVAVLEFADGMAWKGRKRAMAPIVTLAAAQGAYRQILRRFARRVEVVSSTTWTQCEPADVRSLRIRLNHQKWNHILMRDGGLDVHDAIGIGEWRINHDTSKARRA